VSHDHMQVEEEVTEFRSLRLAMRVSKEELRKQPNVVLLEDGGKVAKTAFLLQQKGLNQVNQTPMAQNAAFNIKSGPFSLRERARPRSPPHPPNPRRSGPIFQINCGVEWT
jgi:hypothetical protein